MPRRSLFVLPVLALLLFAPAVTAQAPRALAIADFVDDSDGGLLIRADRLSVDLQAMIMERAAGRLRAVAGEPVRAALRARGYTPRDLVSPTRAAEIGTAVGVEWIVTARWHQLSSMSLPEEPVGVTPPARERRAVAMLDVRVLEVATRRVRLAESFTGQSLFQTGHFALLAAAREALQQAADAIIRL